MYPSDFNSAESVYQPVDDALFLGLPPLLAVLLLALIVAIAAGAYMMGRRASEPTGGEIEKAPGEIYDVILRYASAARAASSNELKQKAEVLDRKIDEYLGPVILVGKDLGGLVKALKQAGEGKIEEPAKPEPQPVAKGCACGGGCRSGEPRGCACGGAHGLPVAAQPLSINQIYIGGAAVPASAGTAPETPARETAPVTADKPDPQPAPKMIKRDMTHQEQVDALDKAVRAFNDHWLNRDKRVEELKAAQAALNTRPPSGERPGTTSTTRVRA